MAVFKLSERLPSYMVEFDNGPDDELRQVTKEEAAMFERFSAALFDLYRTGTRVKITYYGEEA